MMTNVLLLHVDYKIYEENVNGKGEEMMTEFTLVGEMFL